MTPHRGGAPSWACILCVAMLLGSNPAAASELKGRVVDLFSNEPLAGAVIVAESTSEGVVRRSMTKADAKGEFALKDLADSEYEMRASKRGFSSDIVRIGRDAITGKQPVVMRIVELPSEEGVYLRGEGEWVRLVPMPFSHADDTDRLFADRRVTGRIKSAGSRGFLLIQKMDVADHIESLQDATIGGVSGLVPTSQGATRTSWGFGDRKPGGPSDDAPLPTQKLRHYLGYTAELVQLGTLPAGSYALASAKHQDSKWLFGVGGPSEPKTAAAAAIAEDPSDEGTRKTGKALDPVKPLDWSSDGTGSERGGQQGGGGRGGHGNAGDSAYGSSGGVAQGGTPGAGTGGGVSDGGGSTTPQGGGSGGSGGGGSVSSDSGGSFTLPGGGGGSTTVTGGGTGGTGGTGGGLPTGGISPDSGGSFTLPGGSGGSTTITDGGGGGGGGTGGGLPTGGVSSDSGGSFTLPGSGGVVSTPVDGTKTGVSNVREDAAWTPSMWRQPGRGYLNLRVGK